MTAILGYHRLGEYHYFTVFPEGAYWLGDCKDETYHTHESFASLITAIHEHYHLMQDMLQGFCLWNWSVEDELASYVSLRIAEIPPKQPVQFPLWHNPEKRDSSFLVDLRDPLSLAQKYYYERNFVREVAISSDRSKRLIETEVKSSPNLGSWLSNDAYSLTTMDMLECHAALLTELFISKLVVEHPERFSAKIVNDLSPLFRLEHM